jgi:hypothetical protein
VEKGCFFWGYRAAQPHDNPKKATYPELTFDIKIITPFICKKPSSAEDGRKSLQAASSDWTVYGA